MHACSKLCCCRTTGCQPWGDLYTWKDEGTRCPPVFPLLIPEIPPLAIHSSGPMVLREESLTSPGAGETCRLSVPPQIHRIRH